MNLFEDMDDVEEWLEPLGNDAFWDGIAPFDLAIQSRESCDRQIASGSIDEATVLTALKGIARLELVERYALRPRDPFRLRARH